MYLPRYAQSVLAVLILFSMSVVFYVLTGPMHHEVGCPFMPGQEVICTAPLEHLSHWQTSFLAILWGILSLSSLALFFIAFNFVPAVPERERIRYKTRARSFRPTLYEELFSQGILNKKEPDYSVAWFLLFLNS